MAAKFTDKTHEKTLKSPSGAQVHFAEHNLAKTQKAFFIVIIIRISKTSHCGARYKYCILAL